MAKPLIFSHKPKNPTNFKGGEKEQICMKNPRRGRLCHGFNGKGIVGK
jgi:hypothetical protein